MTKHKYFIIIIASILIAASALLLVHMRKNIPQETTTQHTDEKLAPRSNIVVQKSTFEQKQALKEISEKPPVAIGGPAPAPLGCNLYATMTSKQTGNSMTYTVSVSSIGTETCSNVSYSVYYPEGERYNSATPKPSASDYYWILGTMRPEETHITTITTAKSGTDSTEMCATADNAKADACVIATAGGLAVTIPTTSALTPKLPAVMSVQKNSPLFNVSAGKEYGIWVWDSPLSMTSGRMDTIVAQTKAEGMTVIYLTIDDVLTTKDKARFTKALAAFVQKANAQGIAVDAVAGARDWAKPANRWKGYTIIDYVKEYNKTNPKLRGFQYDVEPYLLPEYEGNKAPVLNDFIAFIDASATLLSSSGVRFAVVIPHFYDSTQAWTPKTTLNGVSDYTYTHLLRILNRNPNSTIIVMAYRDYFEGEGGTREIVTPEIQQAGTTKVIVAQETGNVEPDYVTFYGQSRGELFSALGSIQNAFKNNAGFGGIAVHYFDPFIELK